jgi:hypothetical protein
MFTFMLLGTAALSAHHSGTMFDPTKVKEISGTVKEFQWKNPHVWIQLYVQNGGRQEEWSIEGGSPNTLSRNGWRPSTFAPGTSVSIKVNPMKDGSTGGQFIGAKFSDGHTVGNWDRDQG